MTDLLRDPVWNGIAGIIAVIALVIALQKEKIDFMSLTQRFIIVFSRAMVGVLILLPGVSVQHSIYIIFKGGLPLLQSSWQEIMTRLGVSGVISYSLPFTFLPGFISALISATGKTLPQSIQRAIISVIVTLSISDIVSVLLSNNPESNISALIGAIFYNIIGGLIVGPLIAYGVRFIDAAFTQSLSTKTAG